MADYRLTPRARIGLRGTLEHVEGRFGASIAERVLDEFEGAFVKPAENPEVGHAREDLSGDDRVRFWSVAPTLIADRSIEGVVEVLFVERGDRDRGR